MINIVLCGGNGERLWPLSNASMPKQFIKLFDDKSLFQLTIKRNSQVCDSQIIVSNSELHFLALEQQQELKKFDSKYLLEPVGRNTAPAIALACASVDPQEIVLITPSDHIIRNEEEYKKVIKKAETLASEDYLVTFGIIPSFAETGFGYIEALDDNVKAFHEKPDFNTAVKYIETTNHYWNSGMFCFKAGVFLNELKKHSNDIYIESIDAIKSSTKETIVTENKLEYETIRIRHTDMLRIPNTSVDYAVMEKSSRVKVVISDINWSDIGSFDALYDELEKDSNGNTKDINHISINSKNNFIFSGDKQIATIDIQDLIIVSNKNSILITKRGSSQKIKTIVERLKDISDTIS